MTRAPGRKAPDRERNVGPLPVGKQYGAHANRWAILVGISNYADPRLNLRWANRDAQELYELIQTPAGGGFESERIQLLIDGEATTAAVTKALRSFLKKPAREDVVLLYFACHGTPDVDRPSITYLLTHDTDPDDVSGTALPMREIDLSLQENLLAEKVVLIADTCHSAAIGNRVGRRDGGDDATAINAYLEQVSRSKGGVALLTSAESNETAREGKEWGDGHGVFTHFLLRGLKGEADGYGRPKDGVVSVGELFDYVRDNVKRETGDQQHPAIGTTPFDRNLPMAITGGVNAREHLDLGTRLLTLARRLDERERYLAAAGRFTEALSLSNMARADLPQAAVGLGYALLGAGEIAGCLAAVQPLASQTPPPADATEALLLHGVGSAKVGDPDAARSSLRRFVELDPEHEYAGWARSYLGRPSRAVGRRRALVIGIDTYLHGGWGNLSGCVTDAEIMATELTRLAGFDAVTLTDSYATKLGVREAFIDLAEWTEPDDTVIVHYSGHAVGDSEEASSDADELYLVVHDTTEAQPGITAQELHDWLTAIPSRHKTLIIDSHTRRAFMDLAQQGGDYNVLFASDSAQMAQETRIERDGFLVAAGLFTTALVSQLADSNPETLTLGELLDAAIRKIVEDRASVGSLAAQVPVLVGDRDELVFGAIDRHLWAFEFSLRRTYPRESHETLRAHLRRLPGGLDLSFAPLSLSFGCAFLAHGAYDDAVSVLAPLATKEGLRRREVLRLLSAARLGSGSPQDAAADITSLAGLVDDPLRATLEKQAAHITSARRFALVVGVDRYQHERMLQPQGAVEDARLFQTALTERCGFAAEDVVVLVDETATRAAIVDTFRALAERSRTDSTVFYFAGTGSRTLDGAPTIVSANGRTGDVPDITLAELDAIARSCDAQNLVTILDSRFTASSETGSRSAFGGTGDGSGLRALLPLSPDAVGPHAAGVSPVTLINEMGLGGAGSRSYQGSEIEREHDAVLGAAAGVRGDLTHGLVQALVVADTAGMTYRSWRDRAREAGAPVQVIADEQRLEEPIFSNHRLRMSVKAVLQQVYLEPITEAVNTLKRLIAQRHDQGDPDPADRLDLGVALAETADFTAAIEALDSATSRYHDPSVMTRERERDPRADDRLKEAHYQFGRVLYQSGTDYSRAVSELDRAAQLDPENGRIRYYLGQSIREMVERETLAKATDALHAYLTLGAPLGDEDRIREFLAVRRARQTK
ncbi:caspase family protein [Ornithinimicrobium pekingense]|uniref:Peptidase C14 caspase domain-containing protein n=1 Tax=Ornithinimicrobium pekingense TaxID=384677 RepID=A0ABQ2F623_9MICO|nr:caspase family protein [Ornithinimicrobium pekingense]GGK63314.1 hypothetical protein GCM10011509_09650 [Ornithinimicrobium pekingense]